MWRIVLTQALLFLAPFAAYAGWLLLRRKGAFDRAHWPAGTVATIVIVGLAVSIIGFVLLTNFSRAPAGSTYVPAHMENGRFVPGRLE